MFRGVQFEGNRFDPGDLIAAGEILNVAARGMVELQPVSYENAPNLDPSWLALPGLAVPTNLKQSFICPPEHVEHFAKDVELAHRLLVIGWRGTEPHALELLERVPNGYDLAICDATEQTALDQQRRPPCLPRRRPPADRRDRRGAR